MGRADVADGKVAQEVDGERRVVRVLRVHKVEEERQTLREVVVVDEADRVVLVLRQRVHDQHDRTTSLASITPTRDSDITGCAARRDGCSRR